MRPRAVIIDSIQTVYLDGVTGSAGSVSQVTAPMFQLPDSRAISSIETFSRPSRPSGWLRRSVNVRQRCCTWPSGRKFPCFSLVTSPRCADLRSF